MTEEEALELLWKLIMKHKHKARELYYLALGFLGNSKR